MTASFEHFTSDILDEYVCALMATAATLAVLVLVLVILEDIRCDWDILTKKEAILGY